MKKSPYRNEAIVTMLAGIALLLFFIFRSLGFAQEPIGPVTRVTTNELQGISNQLPAVSVVSMSVVGQQSGALYYYWVVAKYGMNVVTQDQPAGNAPQSAPALITNAPSPLSGANYVRVCWNPVPNASGYDVLRTATNLLPNGAANIGVALNTAGNCVNDQGGALQSYTLTTYDPAKNPLSLKWGRMDMPKITPPPQAAPPGQCRLFVNRTTNSYDAVDDTGASCFPTGGGAAVCTDLTQVTNLYVNFNTGNDTTGTGTSGNPWKTIQKAIDAGVPGIVCGRYVIHLQAATTYVGAVRLDGRIFAGGGGFADDQTGWPIVDNLPVPNNFSWVEIYGNPDETSKYIIQQHSSDTVSGVPVAVAGGNLTLTGVTIRLGSFGVHSTLGSFVNLASVKFENNYVGFMGTERSIIHIDNTWFVDGLGNESVLITNNNVGGVPFTGTDGWEMADKSLLTDFLSDGNNTNSGAIIRYTKGTGTVSIGCGEFKDAYMYFRGLVHCDTSGLVALSSNLIIYDYEFDGLVPGTGTAISLRDSQMPGEVVGSTYTVTNALRAVSMYGASFISPYPNIVSATTNFLGAGGDTQPVNVRSRDTFMSVANLIHTVTFSATPAFDMNTNGAIKKITLTADVTSSTITNPRPGEEVTFQICQDAGGAHSFAWPANVLGADAIGVVASKCNVQRFMWDTAASKWYAISAMVKDQ